MKTLLQGRWLGHPLHPMLVHFPIGLWTMSLVLDVVTRFSPQNSLVVASFYAMLGGLAMALVASIPGLADWSDIRADREARKPATTHMLLNIGAAALYAVNLFVRSGSLDGGRVPLLHLGLSALGLGLVAVSGYLGGRIVYDEGVGVGRHRYIGAMPGETLRVGGDAGGEWVEVGDASKLEEGIVRAEVAGNEVAIVRWEGEVYAFQDYCTHRFGPLSEGRLAEGQIECPWHRSCFDVRTGKVTQGPAKIDLKTYKAEVRGGKIHVRPTSN
jgi:nitrite reductase/ring-hydroxylating ferredoxin subunit/uncharacterized membrane protein